DVPRRLARLVGTGEPLELVGTDHVIGHRASLEIVATPLGQCAQCHPRRACLECPAADFKSNAEACPGCGGGPTDGQCASVQECPPNDGSPRAALRRLREYRAPYGRR